MSAVKTRGELLAVFAHGGSVIVNGVHYLSAAELPSEAGLAGNDVEKLADAEKAMQGQVDKLKAELAQLAEQKKAALAEKTAADHAAAKPAVPPATPPAPAKP